MSSESSAETQEDINAYLDRELAKLPSLPSSSKPIASPPKLSRKAAFDAKHGITNRRPLTPSEPEAGWVAPYRCVELPNGRIIPEFIYEARKAKARKRNTPYQRERRREQRDAHEAKSAKYLTDHPPARLTFAERISEARAFWRWLARTGPVQAQFRAPSQRRRYLAARIVVEEWRRDMGYTPDPAIFAARLSALLDKPVDRHTGRNILKRLAKLEGAGGPWPEPIWSGQRL